MNGLWEFAATNKVLLALANVMALLAALAIVWKSVKVSIEFIRTVYRTNVRVAVRRVRRRTFIRSALCADDIHYFVAYVVRTSLLIGFGLATLIVATATKTKTKAEFELDPQMIISDYDIYDFIYNKSSPIIASILLLFITIYIIRLQTICMNEMRLRGKWHRRNFIKSNG